MRNPEMGQDDPTEQREPVPDTEPKTVAPSQEEESSALKRETKKEQEQEGIKYKVLGSKEDEWFIKNLVPEIKNRVKQWHDFKPDCVFLNETSATYFGWMFKEAWKEAYMDETPPCFFRFNPESAGSIGFKKYEDREKHKKNLREFFRKRVKKDYRVVVFDEESMRGHQLGIVRAELSSAGINDKNIMCDRGDISVELSNKIKDSLLYHEGAKGFRMAQLFQPIKYKFIHKTPRYPSSEDAYRDPEKYGITIEEVDYRGKVSIKATKYLDNDRKVEAKSLDYIHDLKQIGKEVGQELRAELEKSKEVK